MKNYNILEYENIPQVAMAAMNDVHREELNIVNKLHSALVGENEGEVSILCSQWLNHTKAHFDRENMMMEKYEFPAIHCHQGEHIEVLKGLEAIISEWEHTHDFKALTEYVSNVWPKWYVNHISTMDVVTSAFIKQSMENE